MSSTVTELLWTLERVALHVLHSALLSGYPYFHLTVASVLITTSKLAMGTYEGEIYVFGLLKILNGGETTTMLVLKTHIRTVYSLASLKTLVTPEGFTSTFPTFLGRAQGNVERELLISIGYGRAYPEQHGESKTFTSFCQQSGCYVNTWFM